MYFSQVVLFGLHPLKSRQTIPAITMTCRALKGIIFSFKNITAMIMVTIDKAEDMGVTNIASPMINPQLTMASAPASKIPAKKIIPISLGEAFAILSSRLARRENTNMNKTIPILTKSVVDIHPMPQ
jgi:hypothetical protein